MVPFVELPAEKQPEIEWLRAHGSRVALVHQWPPEPQRPCAEVWLAHSFEALYVGASLPDSRIVSLATGPNQAMWELGDTFEMFFQYRPFEYFELHVTPDNHRLQLKLPAGRRIGSGEFSSCLLPDPSFSSRTETDAVGWNVLAAVPFALLRGSGAAEAGDDYPFSFCRYDYDELPGEPVLSSTSSHSQLDFHRREDWGVLRLAY